MTLLEAAKARKSRRTYRKEPLEAKTVQRLEEIIDSLNRKSGLHMQLIANGREAFAGFFAGYGMITGVQSYFAMAGGRADPDLLEKLGYYGEILVLEATAMGLGTCWVGGTYNKKAALCKTEPGEELCAVIPVGYAAEQFGLRERGVYALTHRSGKSIAQLCAVEGEAPGWFMSGMEAVQIAPSAVNAQPVRFTYQNGSIYATIPDAAPRQRIDLGIAKLHFELGAGGGIWDWGNNAKYCRGELV